MKGQEKGAGAARLVCAAVLAAALALWARPARGQDWAILAGVADAEFWVSDSGSLLLTRNGGHPAVLGRLQVWAGVAPLKGLQAIGLVEAEGGPARRSAESHVALEGLTLRYALPLRSLVVEGGKLLSPVGAFGPRRLSPVNPLISRPDAYADTYPWGAQISGAFHRFDFRAALVSLPMSHEGYVPEPGSAPRVAVGVGVTPFIGAHLGASYTRGPYLSGDLAPFLPVSVDWKGFGQRILGFDAHLSRGYADLHGELVFSSYDVPTVARPVTGLAYYAEAKYTWVPRFFTALRFQRNKYAFVRPLSAARWIGVATNFYAGEVGLGLWLDRQTLAKVSYQQDDWDTFPDGKAFGLQVSRRFDVMDWLARRR